MMTSPRRPVASKIFGAALVGWFGISVLGQNPKRSQDEWLRKIDRYSLFIPDWRFFAPAPGIHDYHLLVRPVHADGSSGDWVEVSFVEERTLRHVVWHAHRREEKTLMDITSELLRFREEGRNPQQMAVSVPYVTLLMYLDRKAPIEGDSLQFAIFGSGGYDDKELPTLLFISHVHPRTSPAQEAA